MDSIFYGLFLLLLDINVNGTDLLPAFLGYYLMYRGLKQLESEGPRFAEMKPWAIAMAVVNAILFILDLTGLNPETLGVIPVSAGTTVAFLFILYRIVQGIQELEGKMDANLEGALLMRRWKHVCIVQIASYLLSGLLSFKPIRLGIAVAVLALVSFVLYILFLLAFHRSRQAYYAALRSATE